MGKRRVCPLGLAESMLLVADLVLFILPLPALLLPVLHHREEVSMRWWRLPLVPHLEVKSAA